MSFPMRPIAVALAACLACAAANAVAAFEFGRTSYVELPQDFSRAVISTAVGDLDGNGRLDIVGTWYGSVAIDGGGIRDEFGAVFFYQKLDGSFSAPNLMSFTYNGAEGYYTPGVEAANVDADAKAEVLLQRTGGPNGRVDILKLNPGGTYTVAKSIEAPFSTWNETIVEDFDGNGKPDLLLFSGLGTAVFPGLGPLSFGAAQYSLHPMSMSGLNLADLDGNGRKDLLVAETRFSTGDVFATSDFAGDPQYLFRGAPRRVLASPHIYLSGASAGQFGGDATPELVEMHLEEYMDEHNTVWSWGTVGVHARNPDGSYTQVFNRRLGTGLSQRWNLMVETPDIDGDGDQDIVAINPDYDIYILRQTTPGAFAEPVVIHSTRESAWESTYDPTPNFVDIRDFDRDGCLDIGVAAMRGYEIFHRSDCAAPATDPGGARATRAGL